MKNLRRLCLGVMSLFMIYMGIVIVKQFNQEKVLSIILMPKQVENRNDFWQEVIDGALEASKAYEVELEILGPDKEGDYELQKAFIMQAIQKKPDAIVLAAEDYEKTSIEAKKIKEHGIKLIIIDSGIKGKIEDVLVATNNYEAGIKMGYRIKKLLVQGGGSSDYES